METTQQRPVKPGETIKAKTLKGGLSVTIQVLDQPLSHGYVLGRRVRNDGTFGDGERLYVLQPR